MTPSPMKATCCLLICTPVDFFCGDSTPARRFALRFNISCGLQVGHAGNQPFAADLFEIYLHPRLWSLPFKIQYYAVPETGMIDSLANGQPSVFFDPILTDLR